MPATLLSIAITYGVLLPIYSLHRINSSLTAARAPKSHLHYSTSYSFYYLHLIAGPLPLCAPCARSPYCLHDEPGVVIPLYRCLTFPPGRSSCSSSPLTAYLTQPAQGPNNNNTKLPAITLLPSDRLLEHLHWHTPLRASHLLHHVLRM